jgi:hypothetical protein
MHQGAEDPPGEGRPHELSTTPRRISSRLRRHIPVQRQTRCAGAAAPQTLHLDVFTGEADSWNVTSTPIYGKSEAIPVNCQFSVMADLTVFSVADTIALLGRTPAALRRECQ